MTQEELAKVAAEEMVDTLRSMADKIEANNVLSISQEAEDLEMLALQVNTTFDAALNLGVPLTTGERARQEITA